MFFFVLCTLCWQFLWEDSYLRYLCLFTIHILCFCFVFLRLVYPMLAVSLGRLLFTLFVFVYYIVFLFCFFSSCVPYSGIVFLFCFSSSCVPYVGSFSGRALIYVICVCLLYTYCVFVLFFFVLCTLCWQFLWEGSYLRYLCLFTINVLCFCFVFLRLVYPMLAVSLGRLLFTLFVFVYYTHIVFLFFFVLCTLCWQFLWEGSFLRYLCLFTYMLAVSLGGLLFTLFVFVYYKRIVFLFCFSSSCVPYVGSFSGRALIYVICVCLLYTYCVFVLYFFVIFFAPYVGSFTGKALIYVICVCLLYTYCVFVLFFFVLCTLCWQFLWEGSYLRYLCLFTIHILCFCFVFLRLVYPMLAVSLGGLLFTLFVFVYYKRIVFLFCFSSSCVPYVGSFFWEFQEVSYLRYLCLFTIHILCFYFVFLRLVYPMLAVSLGRLLFTLFVFVYYTHIVFLLSTLCWQFLWEGSYLRYLCLFTTHIVFLFCFSLSCVPYVGSFSGKALIYVICVCLLYTYCVFVLFFFVLCTLCWQFLWEGSYLRYLCLFTINVLCFCFVFLRLVYPMLAVSLGGLLFTLFVFVYYTRIVFLFCFSSSCVPYVGSFSGKALIYVICVCLL